MKAVLGPRFDQAFLFASELHRRQLRKGTSIPYISHLLSMAALVLEDGGGEDEAIAALLHDAVEDQGGQATLADKLHNARIILDDVRQEGSQSLEPVVELLVQAPELKHKDLSTVRRKMAPFLPALGAISLATGAHGSRAIASCVFASQGSLARFFAAGSGNSGGRRDKS